MAEDNYLRPNVFDRSFSKALTALVRIGLIRSHFYVLELRGRKSGKTISMPVDPIEFDGRRYLVSPRGYSNWVRNAQAAGEGVLVRGRRREPYTLREIVTAERPPVLKAYLDSFSREVQRFFPIPKGSPVESFQELASRYPVFELLPPALRK